MDIPWDDVHLFLAVAETGSISAGAKRLKLGQPTVSRRLSELEYLLGYQLFRRLPGGVALTSAGERLVAPSRKMAEWAGELSRAASKAEKAPRGLVRVAAPPGVAFDFVAPFAAWLRGKYPLVQLEVLSSVNYLDLGRGEADLAIRLRAPASADLVVVASMTNANAAFASREYAATLPKAYGLADVGWICWAPPFEALAPNPQLAAMIPDFAPVFTSDNFLVQWRAAEAGIGAMILSEMKHRFTRATSLVPLKLDLGPFARSEVHLVSPKSALDIPRVRLVADLLAAEMQRVSPGRPAPTQVRPNAGR